MTGPDQHLSPANLSALELRDALAAGTLTASDVLEHFLAVIAEKNGELGAFMYLDVDSARRRAAELDSRFAASGPVGPLHGIPTAFKDLVNTAGMPTTFGSRLLEHAEPATEDDPLVANVRAAGAVLVGKTTVPEFGLPSYTENLISAPARNPLDPSRTAGGSSGGAASAVASGMLPVAPGNDGGGSVRIPAAACGLVGIKPGRATVPTDLQDQVVENTTVSGPIARTVADAGLLMDAMIDPSETTGPYLAAAQAGALETEPVEIRVSTTSSFAPEVDGITLAPEARRALDKAAELLAGDGNAVAERDVEYPPNYARDFQLVWTSAIAKVELPEGAEALLDSQAAYFVDLVRGRSEDETAGAKERLTDWAAQTRAILGETDVVMTPVLAFAPPEIGYFEALGPAENYTEQCRFTPYTSMVNVTGLPAISVPVLTDDAGLSWSVQLIGRAGSELELFKLAARLERLVRG